MLNFQSLEGNRISMDFRMSILGESANEVVMKPGRIGNLSCATSSGFDDL
jgi:hypothetical protein